MLTPAGAYVPAAMPGMADLTLKMKKIDPDVGADGLQLPSLVSEGGMGKVKFGGGKEGARCVMPVSHLQYCLLNAQMTPSLTATASIGGSYNLRSPSRL